METPSLFVVLTTKTFKYIQWAELGLWQPLGSEGSVIEYVHHCRTE